MIDDYDQISFKNHFFQYFFEPFFLNSNQRPEGFIIVITSSNSVSADFQDEDEIDHEYVRVSELITPLDLFTEESMALCMKARGAKRVEKKKREALFTLQSMGVSLSQIIKIIEDDIQR
ncbi:MAG: hypothetical protein HC828_10730 [Blastochloris sp.]|nr:hypothetical protein [Blastochloris sp.]